MKVLLNKEFVFRLEILNSFPRGNNMVMSISDFTNKLSKDRRTIIKNLKSLVNDSKQLECEKYISIVLNDDNTLTVTVAQDFDINYFLLYYLEKSILFNLCLEIYNSTFFDLHSFATKYFYSYSTVYRQTKKLNQILQQYNLSLDLKTSNSIVGKEQNIRFFYFTLFWESYKVLKWPFEEIEFNKLKEVIEKSDEELKTFLAKPNMVIIWLAVTLSRIDKGYFITEEYEFNEPAFPMLSKEQFYSLFFGFSKDFQILLTLDEETWHYEANFLYFSLITSQIYPLKQISTLKLTAFSGLKINTATLITEKWIERFMAELEIALDVNEYFYLYYNLLSLHSRYLYLPGPVETVPCFTNTSYGKIDLFIEYKLILSFLDTLFSVTIIEPLYAQKDALCTFYLLLISELMKSKRPALNIALYSHSSVFQKEFFEEMLIKNLSFPVTFLPYTSNKVDFLVTDVSLTRWLKKDIPTFVWDSTIDQEKINRLTTYLDTIYTQKYKMKIRYPHT
ncbi:hypothetical protein ABID30_000702 [Enterococcus rotai]|uniref:Mga helix-turn-helix domain-containing protein n=1 Tax=Enterococcus rotai TaxID=118060 RepID=A0A0U2WR38_9ENTE|nr:helix-turn-helix domain-containing protein [Enterococcus rotai]ALS36025.1 hypothetical protein ATZ35_02275 [Enterococcus rotai]